MNGPDDDTRRIVHERDNNKCARCGASVVNIPFSIHHRKPRGMGGTKRLDINYPQNLVLLCGTGTTGCHGEIESNRSEAYATGWLVHQWEAPETVPLMDLRGRWFLLDDDAKLWIESPQAGGA